MTPSGRAWPPLQPIDWISVSLRGLWLTSLPLIAGFHRVLTRDLAILVGSWAVISLLWGLLRVRGWKQPWFVWSIGAADLAFALGAIYATGDLVSPLWSSVLLGSVSLALTHGRTAALVFAALGGLGGVAMALYFSPLLSWGLLFSMLQFVVLMLGAAALEWLAERVTWLARRMGTIQRVELSDVREYERHRARTVFRMAAELNATLNYERVLDLALDLSARALADGTREDDQLVSALLLFDNGSLIVASGRRLTNADRRVELPGESGVIGRALATDEPRVSRDPPHDPELLRLVALRSCEVALCIPLTAGLESYGVLLFAHPRPAYFNAERVELLQAIAQQAMIALQNARLYRDLEIEKERMTEIQEEARKKLARDLHDGPTQSIAAIAMRTNFARRLMERDPKAAADELFKVEDLARRTTKEIRHMLFTLRPLILESQGLVAALYQLAEKLHDTHKQNVIVESEPEVAEYMEMAKQGIVFYIAEEAINNASKHAEAQSIWVRLKRADELFVLEIEDNGVGFNVGAVDANYEQRGSLGIVNMRERTELVNGALHIDSAEGRGTLIRVLVPMTEASAERLHRPGFIS